LGRSFSNRSMGEAFGSAAGACCLAWRDVDMVRLSWDRVGAREDLWSIPQLVGAREGFTLEPSSAGSQSVAAVS
jgi:hypothetical protein